MANVKIKFNGKEFLLSCEDGQEEQLEELLIQINQKFNNLKNPHIKKNIEDLSTQKNQLEIEKQEIEEKYKSLADDYNDISKK